jgi:biotin carboxylase
MSDLFVLIESNTTGTGRRFADTLRAMGLAPLVLCADPEQYAYLKDDGICFRVTDTSNLQAMYDAIVVLREQHKVWGIYSSSDYYVHAAALLAARLRLPGPNPDAIAACRNKYQTRCTLQAAGIPIPAYRLFRSEEGVSKALEQLPLPVIVKPTHGSGSVGVRLCVSRESAMQWAAQILRQNTNERRLPVLPEGLVEEFISGTEYSVETFEHSVIGITRKHVSDPPSFVETGHDFPACLSPSDRDQISMTVLSTLAALGLTWGPAHTELKIGERGLAVIEVNPRLAGGQIPTLVEKATGIDLIRSTLESARGCPPTCSAQPSGFASIRFVLSQGEGILDKASGIDIALSTPGVVDVQMYRKRGEQVLRKGDFRDRIGHVISVSHDAETAAASADKALGTLALEVEPLTACV